MGYTTIFEGKFELNKLLEGETYNKIIEWVNEPENLRWVPTEDRKGLVWDGYDKLKGKKAMDQIWFLIEAVLKPRGYIVNGIVNAQGEHADDQWNIHIENNNVESNVGFHNLLPAPMSYGDWADVHYGRLREMSELKPLN